MDATVPDSPFSVGRSLLPEPCAVYWLWKTLDKYGLVLIYKYSYLLPKQVLTTNTINNLKGMTSAIIIFMAWALNSSHKSHILVEPTFETIMDVCIVGCYIFIGKPIWVTPSNYHTPATITEPKSFLPHSSFHDSAGFLLWTTAPVQVGGWHQCHKRVGEVTRLPPVVAGHQTLDSPL